ncbi:hypothetical protein C3495_01155 [Clostridiaceae bacterium 14S0207]|nr:hypothetical protein C3495_01155 [Clostridiaceae bacterium 14S0207]
MGSKEISIKRMILKGTIKTVIGSILITLLFWFVFIFSVKVHIVNPANYFEKLFPEVKQNIIKNGFNKKELPEGYKYAIYNNHEEPIEFNIKSKDLKYAKEALKKGVSFKDRMISSERFYSVRTKDKKIVIHYKISTTYTKPILNKIFINPSNLFTIANLGTIIVLVYLVARNISRKINIGFKELIDAANKIANQDLDFEFSHTKIREINLVDSAFVEMKNALKISLKEQWDMEEERKTQISAITHDVKTPLMVIYGHADLLLETEITLEQEKHIQGILSGGEQIEGLMQTMLEASRTSARKNVIREKIKLQSFLEEIYVKAKEICELGNIKFKFETNKDNNVCIKEKYISINKNLVERALLNIVKNAIEFSEENDEIEFLVQQEEKSFKFIVHDNGEGLSQKDLKYCTNQFYRGDNSRKRDGHYGLGLYITEIIAKLHNGKLILRNHPEKGAIVELWIGE